MEGIAVAWGFKGRCTAFGEVIPLDFSATRGILRIWEWSGTCSITKRVRKTVLLDLYAQGLALHTTSYSNLLITKWKLPNFFTLHM